MNVVRRTNTPRRMDYKDELTNTLHIHNISNFDREVVLGVFVYPQWLRRF